VGEELAEGLVAVVEDFEEIGLDEEAIDPATSGWGVCDPIHDSGAVGG